jgi:hypothetical protein
MSDAHSGGRYPEEHDIPMNEYASLILTVSVPLEFLIRYTESEVSSKLPVMTYIHGGACMYDVFFIVSFSTRKMLTSRHSYIGQD